MKIEGMLSDMEAAGIEKLPPEQGEGEFTLGELAQAYGASGKSSKFGAQVKALVESGLWEKGDRLVKQGKKRRPAECFWQAKPATFEHTDG